MSKLPIKTTIIITLITAITGFILMVSVRSVNFSFLPKTNDQYQEIISYIEDLESEIATLQDDILSTRDEINAIQANDTTDQDTILSYQNAINFLNEEAGFTEMSGQGIIFTIDDNNEGAEKMQKNNPDMYFPEEYIVHAKDIRYLLNAVCPDIKAISINGRRLVDSSNITCVGTVIMIDSFRLAPPYEIIMIGDPDILEADLINSDRYIYLDFKEMPIKIEKLENLTCPAYGDTYKIDHLKLDNDNK